MMAERNGRTADCDALALPLVRLCRSQGFTFEETAAELDRAGLPTCRTLSQGKAYRWCAGSVRNLCRRHGLATARRSKLDWIRA